MKLFQTTQKNFAALGFIPNRSDHYHVNKHHIRAICTAVLTVTSEFIYILEEADGVFDYMHSILTAIAFIAIFICYFSTISKTTNLYNLIENVQTLTNGSE